MPKTKEQLLQLLREEYKNASQERQKQILLQVEDIKKRSWCRECGELPPDEGDSYPFCSLDCHEKYASREYPPEKRNRGHKTPEQMKQRIQEIIIEKRKAATGV